jgi:hypothetical protein
MNKDTKLIYEAYNKKIEEGILGRTSARLGGLGAAVTQPFKNVGAGLKALGQVATGNVAGATQSIQGIKSAGAAAKDAKIKSITNQYIKKITDDLVKLNLVPANQVDQIHNAVNAAISKVTGAVPQPTPAAHVAAAPAPATKVVPKKMPTKIIPKAAAAAVSQQKASSALSSAANKPKFRKTYK